MDEKQKAANSYSLLRKLDENNSAGKKKTSSSLSKKSYIESSSSRYEGGSSRSTEREKKGKKRLPKEEIDYNKPDLSFGDMYCQICDSHMNSDMMWTAHIQGKRHLKNIKKECPEKKYFDIDEESKLQEEIDTIKKPIVGLDYVIEIQKCDTEIPLFQCFLCNANLSSTQLVIEHLLGLKHRMAYLSKHNQEQFELLERTKFKKSLLEPIVEEEVSKLERKLGRGKIAVKLAKPKPVDPYKRPAVGEDRMSPKRTRNDSATFGHWKPFDSEKRHGQTYYPHPPEEKLLHFPKYPEEQRMAPLDDSRYDDRKLNVRKTNNASHSSEHKYNHIPWMEDMEYLIQSSRNYPYSSSSQKKIDLNELEIANFIQRVNERPSRTLGERSYSGDSSKIDYEKTKKETNPLAEFVKALYSLPSLQFFAIVKTKLETMSIETKEELKALTKLSEQIQAIILSRQLDELGPDLQQSVSELLNSNSATAIPGWKDILNQIQRNNSTNLQNTFSAHQDVSNLDRSIGCVGDGRYSQSTLISPKSPSLPPPETSSSYSLFGPSSSTSIPGLSLSEDQSNISSGFATATRRSTMNDTSSGTYSHFQGFNSFAPGKYWN